MNAYNFTSFKFKKLLPVKFNRQLDGGSFDKKYLTDPPIITWDEPPVNNRFYSYICFDPDATDASFIHLMILNCRSASLSSGSAVFDWSPPNPPKGSGEHRYIFGLFVHSYEIYTESVKDRDGFDIKSFYERNGLIPVAGAFMTVDY